MVLILKKGRAKKNLDTYWSKFYTLNYGRLAECKAEQKMDKAYLRNLET